MLRHTHFRELGGSAPLTSEVVPRREYPSPLGTKEQTIFLPRLIDAVGCPFTTCILALYSKAPINFNHSISPFEIGVGPHVKAIGPTRKYKRVCRNTSLKLPTKLVQKESGCLDSPYLPPTTCELPKIDASQNVAAACVLLRSTRCPPLRNAPDTAEAPIDARRQEPLTHSSPPPSMLSIVDRPHIETHTTVYGSIWCTSRQTESFAKRQMKSPMHWYSMDSPSSPID